MDAHDLNETLERAYLVLMTVPHGTPARAKLQPTLALLRDLIASFRMEDAEIVQNEFEDRALNYGQG